ncbi:MAG TPA: hypothetical protein VEU96_17915 [Bryobacteraceae bacterium]|nr:hypothetical protein [Bryobacteraceae bacterium]
MPRILHRGLAFTLACGVLSAQNVITTLAGVDSVFSGDGQPAINVPIGYINGVATDSAGNVYFTDPMEHLVLRVGPDGILTVIAGNGISAYSGDGGPATSAAVAVNDTPDQYLGVQFEVGLGGIVADKQGNVYFADGHRLRRIAKDGTISTIAGGGTNFPGDGAPATQAALGIINGVTLDNSGNLYFCDNNRVRKLTPTGTLSTYAGTGFNGFSGDNGQAAAARLSQPLGLAFDAQGNLYVADGDVYNFASHIRKISPSGIITTVAGGGNRFPADGVNPLNLDLSFASGLAVDAAGAVYVYAPYNGYLVKFSNGSTTLITSPTAIPFTDNVPARNAYVVGHRAYDNSGIAFDAIGNLYVADSRDGHLCKIDTQGILTTVAGNGQFSFGGDGGPALGASLQDPTSMTQGPDGTVYFLDTQNVRVRAISPAGIITSVLSTDNFPKLAFLEALNGIASDPSGNLFILLDHRVIELSPNGNIQFVVNVPNLLTDSGDGGPATQGTLRSGGGLARDAAGNMYIADPMANRIRQVTPDGIIHTFAGTGVGGVSPDGAVAAKSPISVPASPFPDGQGGLYFQELIPPYAQGNTVLRYITPDGHLKTIAGNGDPAGIFSGDGGPALQAGLALGRTSMALDKAGNLYFTDSFHHRVRVVSPNGIINTFAGNGDNANGGDGGLAINASFFVPRGLLFDTKGNLWIADAAGNRIREALAAPPAILVSPSQMSFNAKAGGALTPPQKLTMSSPVSGLGFSVTKSAGADWLLVAPAGGDTPQFISVRVDPSNLAAGMYQAAITVTSPLAVPVSTSIAVTLQVAPGDPPKLAVDRSSLSFTFPSNPTFTLTQHVRVANAGTGTLAFTARARTNGGGDWLSVSLLAGSVSPRSPLHVGVTANPAGLAAGTYTGVVTIASSTTGESDTVLVALTISTLDQAIQLSHTALSFTAVVNGGVVPPRSFAVTNIGRGSMNFRVSTKTLAGGQQWLSATPSSGVSAANASPPSITVAVNQAGLAPGFYFGLVRVDSAAAANTPQVATVVLHVLPSNQDPGPVIEPNEIVITAVQGAPSPGSRTLSIYNVSATPQTYVSNVIAADVRNRFSFIPANSTLALTQPAKLVLQPLTGSLPPGVYEAELTLQFSDGFVRRVGLRTIVTPPPAGSSIASSGNVAEQVGTAGCTPTQLVPVITTLGQSFGVPAAWPVALETEVRDDCGATLDTGSVKVSFSNGDPPLSLQSAQGGMWNTTWLSGHNTGPVTLTISANDPVRNLAGIREVTGGLGDSSGAPVLNAAVNAASFAGNTPLAPGSIISLFGQDLANGTAAASVLPLDVTLAGATAVMAGNSLPAIFASNGQINTFVSAGITPNTSHQILVQRGVTLSVPISVDVGPSEPAIFGYPLPGDPPSQGAIVNAVSYAVADPATPVGAGDILAIFCTGLGAVDQSIPDGTGAPSSPPANTTATPVVTVGGKPAHVLFSGLSPGFVGLYQIDAVVPTGVTPGNQVPVVISILGQTSPAATIAVK